MIAGGGGEGVEGTGYQGPHGSFTPEHVAVSGRGLSPLNEQTKANCQSLVR